jgi:hypothetical protein
MKKPWQGNTPVFHTAFQGKMHGTTKPCEVNKQRNVPCEASKTMKRSTG